MDDILSRFKRKERGSSSSDSETSLQGKRTKPRTKRNGRDTRRLGYVEGHRSEATTSSRQAWRDGQKKLKVLWRTWLV